jgi:hypothetical protein
MRAVVTQCTVRRCADDSLPGCLFLFIIRDIYVIGLNNDLSFEVLKCGLLIV